MFFSLVVFAQSNVDEYYKPTVKNSLNENISTSVIVGTSMTFINRQNTFYSTYVAPKIGYQLSSKFKLNVGIMHYTIAGRPAMLANSNEPFLNAANKQASGNLLFVEGQYQINPKLIVSGTMMHQITNPLLPQPNYNRASLGIQYKLSDKASIGIGTTISNGVSNNLINPMQGNTIFNNGLMAPMGMTPAFGQ